MKKILLVLVAACVLISGCVMTKSPIQGTLVTDATVHGKINQSMVQGNMVQGEATAKGILGVVTGDCSYETALQDALKNSGARQLKNIVVDYQVKNILWIYAEYTTIVQGIPVK